MQVKLEDILEGLDFTSDEYGCFYRIKTGTVEMDNEDFFEEMEPEFDPEMEDVIYLPNQYEINDRQIMFDFVDQFKDDKQINFLLHRLNGRKPYRRFKDGVLELGIEDAWYAFQAEAYRQIALEWAHENELDVIDLARFSS